MHIVSMKTLPRTRKFIALVPNECGKCAKLGND